MDKYQICLNAGNVATAASKAPRDMCDIAKQAGYCEVPLSCSAAKKNTWQKICEKLNRLTGYAVGWLRAYGAIKDGAAVLLQIPNDYTGFFGYKVLEKLKKRKNIRLICLLHDVDELRLPESDYLRKSKRLHDFAMDRADAVIAHNDAMVGYLASQGVSQEKLVSLEIFDYLADPFEKTLEPFDRSVVIAGNLDPVKCGYIAHLGELPGVNWILYGPNYDNRLDSFDNVTYCGKVSPEVLPEKLVKGFGLIWDGTGLDSCTGSMGAYLRYNNPHKLSLYLTAGLPVVIWEQAAEAAFVRKYGVGICVSSLHDLEKVFETIDGEAYKKMADAVAVIGSQLRSGNYLKTALRNAEEVCRHRKSFPNQ